MRLLLDTHTFIWYVTDNPRLSAHVKLLIEDENNEKLVSIASIWERAIKHSIGRLNFSLPSNSLLAISDYWRLISSTLRLWLHCLCITAIHLTG